MHNDTTTLLEVLGTIAAWGTAISIAIAMAVRLRDAVASRRFTRVYRRHF